MEIINNITKTLRDDLSVEIKDGSKLSIAAACFSIYAFQELKSQLKDIEELRFIFTSPTFVTEKTKKERREFYIPRLNRERSLYGTEFEIKLRNELTQKAIARECADWIKRKVKFKSNVSDKTIQGHLIVDELGYTPITNFTTVELGCEKGNVISTTIVKDQTLGRTLLQDFNEIWNNKTVLQDVTDEIIESISTAYNENPPDFIYFVTLYAIDFDMLKQELSSVVVEGNEERYQFTWPDKKKSILLANAPIAKTLRPCREESVDFDTTENLYIEGDNLDVLKLLQETYLGKIKMIYIDPPYNTGNDFVYNDDFAEDADTYLANSGQYDADGNRLVQNTENNGRFHTDWLNMIYPRLKLSKDLLADDGVIFISIDDHEQVNLKKLCDEVFGEDNFIASLIWAAGRKNDSKYISVSHEYMLCYVKSLSTLIENKVLWRERKQGIDDIYAAYERIKRAHGSDYKAATLALKEWYKGLPDTHAAKNHSHYSCIDHRGIYFPSDISWPGGGGPKYEVLHPVTRKPVKIPNRGWVFPTKARMDEVISQGLVHFGEDENSVPCKKTYLTEGEYATPYSVFYRDGRASTKRLRTLMEAMVFQNPKDETIIKNLLEFTLTNKGSIILDYFSGSATTAHAVMQLNAEDSGNRKFIMVQLPEETDSKSEAYKAGYKNICEIGKERIRRAGKKIKEESPLTTQNLDTGFRVLKLDSSNMKDVYYTPADYEISMFDTLADNIKEDRTPEDLLFQVMLDLGVLLSSKIEETTIAGKKVFNVADGFLMACFDENVSDETITAVAKQKPYYFLMRDSSLASDSVATNFDQIFATYSPDTVRKVL